MYNEDENFDKAVGQFRLTLNGVLSPLRFYGQSPLVDMATEEIVSLAIQLHYKLSGVDEPYMVNHNMEGYKP